MCLKVSCVQGKTIKFIGKFSKINLSCDVFTYVQTRVGLRGLTSPKCERTHFDLKCISYYEIIFEITIQKPTNQREILLVWLSGCGKNIGCPTLVLTPPPPFFLFLFFISYYCCPTPFVLCVKKCSLTFGSHHPPPIRYEQQIID